MADKTQTAGNYTDSAIVTNEGLDIIRQSPTQYLPDTETAGLTHQIVEIQDNAFDEVSLMGPEGVAVITLYRDTKRNTYQVTITDNGRGIPLNVLVRSFTVPHTSGKYNTDVYKFSGGLFGVGGKVAAGLSNQFRAVSMRRAEGSMSVHVQRGKIVAEDRDEAAIARNGMAVALEPDDSIFGAVDEYMEAGWGQLMERIKTYAYFYNPHIILRISEKPFSEAVWSASNAEFADYVYDNDDDVTVVFDSTTFDKMAWLKTYLNCKSDFVWAAQLFREDEPDSGLAYDTQIYFASTETAGGRLGLINSIPIHKAQSYHLLVTYDVVKETIAPRITNADVRQFFLDNYRLPLYLVVNVKFKGAKFIGTTKDNFKSPEFRAEYSESLREQLSHPEYVELADRLYALIEADVSEKFMIALSGQKLSSKAERNFSGLNFPKKYAPCTGKDGANNELFIVEGDSAGTGVRRWRDPETMGIYSIRGKPYNALRVNVNLEDAARDIAQNDIYQDIMRLVGIHPGMTDMSGLKYQRIVILTDADPDGHHIASLLISNLYAVCPAFVEDGRLLWVEPPYYAVTHTSGRSAKKIYMRTSMDLIAWLSEVVYEPAIGISVDYGLPNDEGEIVSAPQELSGMDYTAFVAIVRRIGQTIDNLSSELSINPDVLYMLTFVSHLLNGDDVDVIAVNNILGIDNVVYSKERQTITLAIGEQDHYVPLYRTMSRIYDELMPLLRDIRWRNLDVQITYRNIAETPTSSMPLYQIYLLLQSFDHLFRVEPLKGLGSMDPKDCAEICLNPINRQEHVIRGLGSDLGVFDLLGRTSSARKQVLSDMSQ